MHTKKALRCWAFVLVALSFLAPSTTLADGFYVTPSLGVYNFDHQYGLDDDSVGIGSLGFEWGLSPNVGIEVAGSTNFDNKDVDLKQLRVDGLWYLKDASAAIRPYLIGGVGFSDADFTDGLIEDNQSFFLDAGLGLKFKLTDQVAIRSDVRHVHTTNEDGQDLAVNVGFAFKFGHKPAATPVPEIPPSDRDGDGVIDSLDQCPLTPSVAAVDDVGCPLDLDKDGVADYKDQCLGTLPNVMVDRNGCARVIPEPPIPAVGIDIYYDTNSSAINSEYDDELVELSDYMNKYPSVDVIAEGHTDSRGSEKYNMELSVKRAESVKAELSKRYGIDSDRVNAVGKGETQPKATNRTPEGRALNRRVNVRTAPLELDN